MGAGSVRLVGRMPQLTTADEVEDFNLSFAATLSEWTPSEQHSLPDIDFLYEDYDDMRAEVFSGDGAFGIGTESFNQLTPEELDSHLGWAGDLPAPFKRNGNTADTSDSEAKGICWHQKTAVAAILQRMSTAGPGVGPGQFPGVLLADGVGVGKTCIVLCTIAALIVLREFQVSEPDVVRPSATPGESQR